MNQLNAVMHEEIQNEINPFGIELEAPLRNLAAYGKLAPKLRDDGDIGKAGSIHGGG